MTNKPIKKEKSSNINAVQMRKKEIIDSFRCACICES